MSGYAFHPEAFADIDEIRQYLAERSARGADHAVERLFDTCRRLASFPHLGHPRPDLTGSHVLFHPVDELLIVYTPRTSPVCIVAILHGHRHPRAIK